MTNKPNGTEKRNDQRLADPDMNLKLGGKPYRSGNWSMGGILIDDYDGELSTGALLTITEIGSNLKKLTTVNIRARVIRADTSIGHLAVQFLELDSPAYGVFQELMRKKMKTVSSL